jgi:hypothetical protein
MQLEEVLELQVGDQVFWNDPEDGLCSRFYTIAAIEIEDDMVRIVDTDGSELECFAYELSEGCP